MVLLPVLPHYFYDIAQISGLWSIGAYNYVANKDRFWLFDLATHFVLPCLIIFLYFWQGWLKWSGLDIFWINPALNISLALLLAIALWFLFFLRAVYIHNYLESICPSTYSLSKFFYSPSDGLFRYSIFSLYIALSARITSVALFASIHLASGATFMFNALVAEIVLSIVYVKTRNIFLLMMAHFLIDISFVSGFDNILVGILWSLFI